MRRYHYKFRAECEADVDALIRRLPKNLSHSIKVKCIQAPFPDVEVDLFIALPIKMVRETICRIVDGHVMLETLAIHTKYTGNRDPDITCYQVRKAFRKK